MCFKRIEMAMDGNPFSFYEKEFTHKDIEIRRRAVEHTEVIAKVLGEEDTRGYLIPFLQGLFF